jgi:hypothetical protein
MMSDATPWAEALGRAQGRISNLDRNEFGEQYALALSFAYHLCQSIVHEEMGRAFSEAKAAEVS